MFVAELFDGVGELVLRFEDEVDGVAACALSAAVGCCPMADVFDLLAGVGGGDGQSAVAECGKVDDVVSDEADLFECDAGLCNDLGDGLHLVGLAHIKVFDFEVAGAQGYCVGDAFGDEAAGESADACERDAEAVVGVEALGFDHGRWVAEADLAFRMGGFCCFFCAGGAGEEPDSTVGEDAVYVKENDADFFRAFDCVGAGLKEHGFSVLDSIEWSR